MGRSRAELILHIRAIITTDIVTRVNAAKEDGRIRLPLQFGDPPAWVTIEREGKAMLALINEIRRE